MYSACHVVDAFITYLSKMEQSPDVSAIQAFVFIFSKGSSCFGLNVTKRNLA